jgi:hypothetical protein
MSVPGPGAPLALLAYVGVPAGAIRLPFGGSVFPKNPSPVGHIHTSGKPLVSTYGAVALLIDFRLGELCQVSQRLLPTEIASLQRNGIWQAFLHNIKLGSERDFLERHRHLNLTRQVGIVEFVGVAQAFMGHELNILAAKRMVVSRGKIPERHSKRATDFRVQLMHCTHKAIWSEPFRQRIRFDECAIDLLWPGCQDTMQTNSVRHTYFSTKISGDIGPVALDPQRLQAP